MVNKFFSGIRKGELVMTSVIFMSSLIVLTINIATRKLFNSAIPWAEEYMRYSMIWVTFIGTALCVEDDLHVGIDIVFQMSPLWLRKVLKVFTMISATYFCAYMVVFSSRNTMMLFNTMQRSPVMLLPMWVVYISMPIGALFSTLNYGRKTYQYATTKVSDFKDNDKGDGSDIDLLTLN